MNRLLSQDDMLQDLRVFMRVQMGEVGSYKPHLYRMWGKWWAIGIDCGVSCGAPDPESAYHALRLQQGWRGA